MEMRIKLFHMPIAALLAVLLASLGCATAQKPPQWLPACEGPPPIQASPAKTSQPQTPPATAPAPAPAPKPEVKPAEVKPDPVAELIAKVEKEYQAGEEEYSAGDKDAAKEHYDRASALLTAAAPEVQADPRFQHEHDRVAEGLKKLEATA